MPLQASGLEEALKDVFEGAGGYPADAAEAGRRWAKAYKDYAAGAVAGPTAPVAALLATAETTLAGVLEAGFTAASQAGPGGLAAVLPLLDAAFVGFWLAPPVQFVVPVPPPVIAGVVSLATPGVLSAGLAGPLGSATDETATAVRQAQLLSTVLDGWTRTVMVLNTPVTPPGPPVTVPLT